MYWYIALLVYIGDPVYICNVKKCKSLHQLFIKNKVSIHIYCTCMCLRPKSVIIERHIRLKLLFPACEHSGFLLLPVIIHRPGVNNRAIVSKLPVKALTSACAVIADALISAVDVTQVAFLSCICAVFGDHPSAVRLHAESAGVVSRWTMSWKLQ